MKFFAFLPAVLLVAACVSRPPVEQPSEEEESLPEPWLQEPAQQPLEPPSAYREFVVTKEVYDRTFEEINELIGSLNEIIHEEDYEGWLGHLSDEYIRTTSDPEWLATQSEAPLLRQADIRLRDLHDYFTYVVVPSRTQAELGEIEFLDENHVKAVAELRGRRVILYLLVREAGRWKVGLWHSKEG